MGGCEDEPSIHGDLRSILTSYSFAVTMVSRAFVLFSPAVVKGVKWPLAQSACKVSGIGKLPNSSSLNGKLPKTPFHEISEQPSQLMLRVPIVK